MSSFVLWACMRSQHIHVCTYHMHTHKYTHMGGFFKFCFQWLWLTENGIKSTDSRRECVVFNRRISGAWGMGWGSEWRGAQRSQHSTCRHSCKVNSEYGLGRLNDFRRASEECMHVETEPEQERPFSDPSHQVYFETFRQPQEVGQPTEERDRIYHQQNACVSRADCCDMKYILVFFFFSNDFMGGTSHGSIWWDHDSYVVKVE